MQHATAVRDDSVRPEGGPGRYGWVDLRYGSVSRFVDDMPVMYAIEYSV